uniref:Uncharacterized protein n=1 Tax=Anguilla anguilla TaxID=7936 RepID=A0A0E9V187_ANGAN
MFHGPPTLKMVRTTVPDRNFTFKWTIFVYDQFTRPKAQT